MGRERGERFGVEPQMVGPVEPRAGEAGVVIRSPLAPRER